MDLFDLIKNELKPFEKHLYTIDENNNTVLTSLGCFTFVFIGLQLFNSIIEKKEVIEIEKK